MRRIQGFVVALALAVVAASAIVGVACAESIDGRVVTVELPVADVTLSYVETPGAFSVELDAGNTAVRGQKFYLGDGQVAVELRATESQGILFQGTEQLNHGYVIKKYDVVKVRPGFKRASELKPGDVYVIFPGLQFVLPTK
ncbi:MAG: hypothetical protein U0935_10170 [Pirellulales bacterium]